MTARGHRVARPHQQEAIKAALGHFARGDRAQVVMACGTGKTLVGQRVAESLAPGHGVTLVLCPTISLTHQSRREWQQAAAVPFEALTVCTAADIDAVDAMMASATTTSALVIGEWIAKPGRRVVFATYASARRVGEALASTGGVIDVVIADEAHRLAGYGDRPWGMPLDNARLPARYRLHLTATPRIHTADGSGQVIVSMDDTALFGEVAYELTFAEAIARGLLSEYRVVVVAVRRGDVHAALLRDGVHPEQQMKVRNDTAEHARDLAILGVIQRWGLASILVYCNRIESSRELLRHLRSTHTALRQLGAELPDIHLHHVDASSSVARRHMVLAALRARQQVTIVGNVKLFGEGVDVPALDAVVFAEPRSSPIDITQAVGRALRLKPGVGKKATILIPVWVGDEEDADAALSGSPWEAIQQTLIAIGDHDNRIVGALNGARESMDEEVTLREHLRVVGASLEDLSDLREAITLRLLDHGGLSLRTTYGRVAAWAAQHGTADIPRRAVDEHGPLGQRVSALRRHQDDVPRPWFERFAALPGWRWTPTRRRWLPDEDARLFDGTPTAQLAGELGRTPGQIASRRSALNVGPPKLRKWSAADDEIVLTMGASDGQIGQRLGRTAKAVSMRRQRLTRAASTVPSPHAWTEIEDQRILDRTAPDSELAVAAGVSLSAIASRRSYLRKRAGEKSLRRLWTPQEDAIITDPALTTADCVAKIGRTATAIDVRRRKLHGVRPGGGSGSA